MPLLCATFWQPGATAITFTYHNFPATVGHKFFQLPCGSGLVPFSVSSNWYVHSAITPTWHAPFLPFLRLSLFITLPLSLCLSASVNITRSAGHMTDTLTHGVQRQRTCSQSTRSTSLSLPLPLSISISPPFYLYCWPRVCLCRCIKWKHLVKWLTGVRRLCKIYALTLT